MVEAVAAQRGIGPNEITPPAPSNFVKSDDGDDGVKKNVEEIFDSVGPMPDPSMAPSGPLAPKQHELKKRVEEIRDDEGPPPNPSTAPSDSLFEKSDVTKNILAQREMKIGSTGQAREMQIDSTGNPNANDDDAPKDENGDENTPQTNNDGANLANIDFNASTDAEQGQDDPIFIPNAYLVPFSGHGGEHEANNNDNAEDDNQAFVVGEPLLPWWKQTRTRLLFLSVFVAVTIMAIALGVTLSKKPDTILERETVHWSSPPSTSIVPSLAPSEEPSISPSLSLAPTPSPTTYLKSLDKNQKVATDGATVVVVTRESSPDPQLSIIFYSLMEDGIVRVGAFREDDYGQDFNIVLDGNATISVEFPDDCDGAGSRLDYERDGSGLWEERNDSRCVPVDEGMWGGGASEPIPVDGDWSVGAVRGANGMLSRVAAATLVAMLFLF